MSEERFHSYRQVQRGRLSIGFCFVTVFQFRSLVGKQWTCQFSVNVLFSSGCHSKVPQTGRIKQQTFISRSSRGCKSKAKMSAGLVSPEASLLRLQSAAFLLPRRMLVPLCNSLPGVWLQISSSCKDTGQMGSGPTRGASFQLNHLFKGSISKYSHILRS